MEMKELVRLARMRASGTIPDESRQSLPIPIRRNGRLFVAFLFVPTVKKPGAPVQLGAPDYIATLRVSDGRLESLQSLEADPTGALPADPSHSIGTFGLPDKMTAEEYVKRQAELFAAYDVLLPLFERPEDAVGQNGRDWARYFQDLFQAVSEPPLRPYYESFGAEFFRWVSQAAAR
jgi:hypothetical protein